MYPLPTTDVLLMSSRHLGLTSAIPLPTCFQTAKINRNIINIDVSFFVVFKIIKCSRIRVKFYF